MATTALFVEILVIGAIAELWIISLLLAGVEPAQTKALLSQAAAFKDFATSVLIFVLAMTYGIGWIVNFGSERIFKRLFQSSLRDPLFEGSGTRYEDARLLVLQKASADFLHEVQLDRHIIRIARANALNFGLLASSLLLHVTRLDPGVAFMMIGLLVTASLASFYQWKARYTFQYQRIAAAAKLLRGGNATAIPADVGLSTTSIGGSGTQHHKAEEAPNKS